MAGKGTGGLGDDDLLIVILRADKGSAAEALSSLGVTFEGARDEYEGMLSDALSSVGISLEEVRREARAAFDMSIPDNRRGPSRHGRRKCWSERKGRRCGSGIPPFGPEHALLGRLRNEDGSSIRVLASPGVS